MEGTVSVLRAGVVAGLVSFLDDLVDSVLLFGFGTVPADGEEFRAPLGIALSCCVFVDTSFVGRFSAVRSLSRCSVFAESGAESMVDAEEVLVTLDQCLLSRFTHTRIQRTRMIWTKRHTSILTGCYL